MFAKLLLDRPGGLSLTIKRQGNAVTAYLAGDNPLSPFLAFATGVDRVCYLAREEADRRSLCIGSASFHLTAEEATDVRDRLCIREAVIGSQTSFEASIGELPRMVAA